MGSPLYCAMGSHLCRCRLHIWSEAPKLPQHDCMRSSTTQWSRCLLLRALNVLPVGTETELSMGERHGSWGEIFLLPPASTTYQKAVICAHSLKPASGTVFLTSLCPYPVHTKPNKSYQHFAGAVSLARAQLAMQIAWETAGKTP